MKKMIAVFLSLMMLCAAVGSAAESAAPFATVAQVLENTEFTGCSMISGSSYSMVVRYGDRWIRVVSDLGEEGLQAYEAILASGDYDNLDARLSELVASLPVSYMEELTGARKTQEELDATVGKTLYELTDEGYEFYSYTFGEGNDEVSFDLSYGLFLYHFIMNESSDTAAKMAETDDFGPLTVKSASFAGVSNNAADLAWNADGTYTAPEAEDDPFASLLQGFSGLLGDETGEAGGETSLNDLLQSLGGAFSEAGEEGGSALSGLLESLGGSLSEAGENGEAKLNELLESLGGALSEAGENGEAKLSDLLKLLEEKEPELENDLGSMLDSLFGLFQ